MRILRLHSIFASVAFAVSGLYATPAFTQSLEVDETRNRGTATPDTSKNDEVIATFATIYRTYDALNTKDEGFKIIDAFTHSIKNLADHNDQSRLDELGRTTYFFDQRDDMSPSVYKLSLVARTRLGELAVNRLTNKTIKDMIEDNPDQPFEMALAQGVEDGLVDNHEFATLLSEYITKDTTLNNLDVSIYHDAAHRLARELEINNPNNRLIHGLSLALYAAQNNCPDANGTPRKLSSDVEILEMGL